MAFKITHDGDRALVQLTEPFDSDTAAALTHALEGAPPDGRVVVDLTFLRDRRLAALVVVADACGTREGVTVRGVSAFGARVLAYLGKTKLLRPAD